MPMDLFSLTIEEDFDLTEGDELIFTVQNDWMTITAYQHFQYEFKNVYVECIYTGLRIGIGHLYPIAKNLPDLTQVEFLKSFLQLFGFFIKQKGTEVFLINIDDLILKCNDSATVNDWTSKFAPDEDPEINFVTELSKKNWCRYTEDDPLVGVMYDDYILISDETLTPESEYIKLPYGASEMVRRMGGYNLPSIKAITDFEWSESPSPRIIIDDTQTTIGQNWQVKDGITNNSVAYSSDIPLCYFTHDTNDDLSWQKLLTLNYSKFADVYLHPVIIKQKFWLSILDIYNLDQFIPIYCEQLGGYYIVMKVTNWINGQATECELLKIK
jgi:hypothetical protein